MEGGERLRRGRELGKAVRREMDFFLFLFLAWVGGTKGLVASKVEYKRD